MRAYVLNLESRPERLENFWSNNIDAEVIKAIPNENKNFSFSVSMVKMLHHFVDSNEPVGALFEDDAVIAPAKNYTIAEALLEVPDFDLFYLGGNMCGWVPEIKQLPPVRHTAHTVRIRRCLTTHAIIYTRTAAERILSLYEPQRDGTYDFWLCRNFLEQNRCYMISPPVARQRAGFSDLEQKETDHASTWDATELAVMKAMKRRD